MSGISTLNIVGILTTNPQTPIQIETYGVKTGFGTFSASVGVAHTIDTFTVSTTDFKTAEYTLHVGYGTYTQAQKVLLMQNGITAYSQEYAVMYDLDVVVSVDATMIGNVVSLQIVPETGVTGLTTYRFIRQTIL